MSEHIQDLTFDQYQAAAGVSNSMLKVIRERTPLHLWWQLHHEKPEPTPAQRFGSLTHTAILTPDLARFHTKPEGMKFNTKAGMEWEANHQDAPIISAGEAKAIDAMKASVYSHPAASRLLKNADFERSLFAIDAEGTTRKLRPDILPHGGDYLPDLKTCESAHPDEFAKAVANYQYFVQAAYYLDGCAIIGRKFRAFAFIAVEKSPPYASAVYVMDPEAIEFGRKLYRRDLQIYRDCLKSNQWPGYAADPRCIGLPAWMQKQAEEV